MVCTSLLADSRARGFDLRPLFFIGFLIAAQGKWLMTGWSLEIERRPTMLTSKLLAFAPLDMLLKKQARAPVI